MPKIGLFCYFKERKMMNKKVFAGIVVLLMLVIGVSYAQTVSDVETQINQSIQRNQTEYERLLSLQQDAFNNRQIALLQRQHNALRSEIATIQREIETLINRGANKETISNRMRALSEKMIEEERMLRRIDALKAN